MDPVHLLVAHTQALLNANKQLYCVRSIMVHAHWAVQKSKAGHNYLQHIVQSLK